MLEVGTILMRGLRQMEFEAPQWLNAVRQVPFGRAFFDHEYLAMVCSILFYYR